MERHRGAVIGHHAQLFLPGTTAVVRNGEIERVAGARAVARRYEPTAVPGLGVVVDRPQGTVLHGDRSGGQHSIGVARVQNIVAESEDHIQILPLVEVGTQKQGPRIEGHAGLPRGKNRGVGHVINLHQGPVLLDCDPGQDDAVNLLLAFAATEELDVLGVTTVAGNHV